MQEFKTEQERFWAGAFGDDYSQRNVGTNLIASNLALFFKILDRTREVKSILEFGANIGLNLQALRTLLPSAELSAVEINNSAVESLKAWSKGTIKIYASSILDFKPDRTRDLVFTKGVLIHINPDHLSNVYRLLYESSSRYICLAEYYNPIPVTVPYRGNENRLFKRDFAGELMSAYPDLYLLDYGFVYHKDNCFPQDDVNWFLFVK